MGANRFDEAAAIVRVCRQGDGIALREESSPIGVEEIDPQGGVQDGQIAAGIARVEFLEHRQDATDRRGSGLRRQGRLSRRQGVEERMGGILHVQEIDVAVLHLRHFTASQRVDERRHERVVVRAAVLAEQVR